MVMANETSLWHMVSTTVLEGFFYKPYKGARDEGMLGFAKGCGKGLSGIVYEPIYGK